MGLSPESLSPESPGVPRSPPRIIELLIGVVGRSGLPVFCWPCLSVRKPHPSPFLWIGETM